jgi:uncharacterized protein YceH (UPF0502 family)
MDKKTEATINQLCHQRNREADAVAQLCGEIAERDEEIAELKARLAELEAGPAAPGT